MRITPSSEASRSELSVVPLVNVVFLLLVFFMLVGQVVSPEPLPVDPPRSSSGEDDTGQTVKLLMTRDGRLALDNRVIAPDQLDGEVSRILDNRPTASFQVKADGATEAVTMIRTMERLREAGVERITLLTEQVRGR